jgi:NAD(P)-dependent dehydrogenase (short-subunit alcohol dehydrogenase family)
LLDGADDRIEAALRERRLEIVRDGEADGLVTLGPKPELRDLADVSPQHWRSRFAALAEEPFWVFQRWLQAVLRRGAHGRWVAVTNILGTQPFPGGGPDGASAVALQTLVRIAAIEYGARGIRANVIAPGWREHHLPVELDRELAVADTPSGRLASDSDIAATVAWLLSDEAEQVNGEILRLDGGYTITRGSRPDPYRR